MPAALKVVIAANVVSFVALALLALASGDGFTSGVFPPGEGHELRLIPIERVAPVSRAAQTPVQRVEIPPEYRTPDPIPSPWVAIPDGSVRFVRSE